MRPELPFQPGGPRPGQRGQGEQALLISGCCCMYLEGSFSR